MLSFAKKHAFRLISMNRKSVAVKALHKAFSFVDDAFHNRGSNFFLNGEANLLKRMAKTDMRVAFDVGANVGHWSEAALAAWPNCKVHAFEIAPPTAERFKTRLAADISNNRVIFNDIGLSDCSDEIDMYYYPGNDELTSHERRHAQHPAEKFVGIVGTLNKYTSDNNIDHIDFLKIDIEGHEFKVMQGGSDLIANGKVSCIQFEYGAFSTESRFFVKDYYELLPDFWLGKLFPDGVHFAEYDWTMENFQFCNYVAVHKAHPNLKNLLSV